MSRCVLVNREFVQKEAILCLLFDRGHRYPPEFPWPRLDDNLAADIYPADDAGEGGLVTGDPASKSRPRVKAPNKAEGADDGGLLRGEVLAVPLLQRHLQPRDLGDDLVEETHLEADELVDLLVPGGQPVEQPQQFDALLRYGAAVRCRHRHAGTPTLPNL